MDAGPSLHPTEQTLGAYGLGKFDDQAAEVVDRHLEECDECRNRVASMSADSFLDRMREAHAPAGASTIGRSQFSAIRFPPSRRLAGRKGLLR